MLGGLILILVGVLSASGFIIARRPDAQELIDKLAPFQGVLGAGAALWGGWQLIDAVAHVENLTSTPLSWITWLAVAAVTLGNGFLLGFGLAMSFVSDEEAKEKARAIYRRIEPYQSRLGLAAIALGAWSVVSSILIH